MPFQKLVNFVWEQSKPKNLLELRLTANKLSRSIGSQTRVIVVATIAMMPFCVMLMLSDRTGYFSKEALVSWIIFLALAAALTNAVNDVFLKTLATQITLKEAPLLEQLAFDGNAEAAFCLADLHARRGADAHELMWLQRAAGMGHRKAAKLVARRTAKS